MNRIALFVATCGLAVGLLAGCAPAGSNSTSSAASVSASAASAPQASASASSEKAAPIAAATSDAAFVSSDAGFASSDAGFASSDSGVASSDRGSASSDSASSDGRSSEPVLSGPSGIAEMGVKMNYMSAADLLAALGKNDPDLVVVDLRKPADAKAGHIEGAIFAPVDKAVDNNNYADALANVTSALHDATGNEVGEGKKLVLACYAGKKYAQAATDILNALGADMDNVYTLEGGMNGWIDGGNPVVTD